MFDNAKPFLLLAAGVLCSRIKRTWVDHTLFQHAESGIIKHSNSSFDSINDSTSWQPLLTVGIKA